MTEIKNFKNMEHYKIEHHQDSAKVADLDIPVEYMIKYPQEVAALLETLPFLDKAETELLHFLQEKVEDYVHYYNTAPDCVEDIYDTCYKGEKIEATIKLTYCKKGDYGWTAIKDLHIDFYKVESALILRKL